MPAFHVEKSMEINASPDTVYKFISDFSNWRAWSPWLILEPEAKVNVKSGGKEYSWEGKRTGSGEMKVLNEKPPQRLDMVVTFLKPWKSTSSVWFDVKPSGSGTLVTWSMDGSLPFFLFFMKKMMTAYIGMDYTRGLMMLKDCLETGSVPSILAFKGITNFPGCTYVGMRTSCTLETVGPMMKADFDKLNDWVKAHSDKVSGVPLSIYHRWDLVKNKIEYTSAIPVKEIPATLPAGAITGNIPAVRVNTIAHTGPYKHLGNAWSAQYNMQQAKLFKWKKGVDPFETYVSMPGAVPDNDLITEIHFPVA
jgi:uncharacterized protein YndB with AHSA1/START domain/DNA gyrase inhibitor GyrI